MNRRGPLSSRFCRGIQRASAEFVLKTQGEIEAAVCAGMVRFEQDYMGRGPKGIRAHLLGDRLVVRLTHGDPGNTLDFLPQQVDRAREELPVIILNLLGFFGRAGRREICESKRIITGNPFLSSGSPV
jgi:hypothetical protein